MAPSLSEFKEDQSYGSWQDLWSCGEEPTLEQSIPEGLHPVEWTHAGGAFEGLQPVGRTHVEEILATYPNICWRDNTTGHKQSRRFLECKDDKFRTPVIEETTRRGGLLYLILKPKEGLMGDVKVKGSLGCSDHEMVEFRTLRGG
ncbi:hypothetical protein GRJ2_002871700 [Grus japonensis]|uniref:Uncharacterized protein n=1 Tax=Grus japonensis TaxID=30415 RepID=A0ABC9Y3C8_GRUJA